MTYPQELVELFRPLPAKGIPRYVDHNAWGEISAGRPVRGTPEGDEAIATLIAAGEEALGAGPFSVTQKTALPASGNPHDYFSVGPYWWPNPATPDGLPYVRRDGEMNPDFHRTDRTPLEAMTRTVASLCRAYALTRRPVFASRAARLLRAWFLDEATNMTPHLEYGQAIPGHCTGRGIGIIDTMFLATRLLPALGLIEDSEAWPDNERQELQGWFHAYLKWLLTSGHGIDEARTRNNHGVAYDLQVAVFALFIGAEALAQRVLLGVPARRIVPQIEPDGRQPEELARTRSLTYSTMNLSLFLALIAAGRCVGVDLASYESPDGRSIRRALDWMAPFLAGRTPWPYPQITPFSKLSGLAALNQAAHLWASVCK